jgi:hypothetical protein
MVVPRVLIASWLILGWMGAGAREAAALHGSEDTPKGTLAVPGGGSAWIPVQQTQPGDTLQWTWTVVSGSPDGVSALLVWTDDSGRLQQFAPGPAGQAFGTFFVPRTFQGARLVWRNPGTAAAEIRWEYGASAPFWQRPDMFLPALIPVILLLACYLIGRVIDRQARHRRHAVTAIDRGAELAGMEREV